MQEHPGDCNLSSRGADRPKGDKMWECVHLTPARSDSDGEDLAGYAGAGLYDSVLLQPPRRTEVDDSEESLVWDRAFRDRLLGAVGQLGVAIEQALGSPQDIEGAVAKAESRCAIGAAHANRPATARATGASSTAALQMTNEQDTTPMPSAAEPFHLAPRCGVR